MKFFRITLSYCCYGIITNDDNVIIKSAPIGRWTIGKKLGDVCNWVINKKGTVELVKKYEHI